MAAASATWYGGNTVSEPQPYILDLRDPHGVMISPSFEFMSRYKKEKAGQNVLALVQLLPSCRL